VTFKDYSFNGSRPPEFKGVIVKQHLRGCVYPRTERRKDCRCPKYFYVGPGRIRVAAGTTSWEEAEDRGRHWVKEHDPRQTQRRPITPKSIGDAFDDYLETKQAQGLKPPSLSKIRTIRNQMLAFIADWNKKHADDKLLYVHEIKLPHLKAFVKSWDDNMPLDHGRNVGMSGNTKAKRICYLREFFDHCLQAEWVENTGKTVPDGRHQIPMSNPANFLESTGRGLKAKDKLPLSDRLYSAILDACLLYETELKTRNRKAVEGIGSRSQMFCELMYNTGFSVTDAMITSRTRLKRVGHEYYFDVQRRKLEGDDAFKPIWMKVDKEFAERLLRMKSAPNVDEKYFFWTGRGAVDNAADSWQKLFAIIRMLVDPDLTRSEMGVDDHGQTILPTCHCFRYSFAQNLFVEGADIPEVAKLMGDSPEVVRKHYYKWSPKLAAKANAVVDKMIERNRKARQEREKGKPMLPIIARLVTDLSNAPA
jgi:hypothetical protein